MNTNIKATNIELTPAIAAYAEKKIGSLEKYLDEKKKQGVFMIEVGKTTEHHKQGEIFFAEVKGVGAGLNLYARETAEDLYAAIDLVEAEAARELKTEKGRAVKLLRRGQRVVKDMVKDFPWVNFKKKI